MITAAILAKSIGNILYGYFAKKGLDKIIPKKVEFTSELSMVIIDTLEEYKTQYPIQNQGDKFPFYHSQRVIEELLKFRVMHSEDYSVEDLWNSFRSEPNVIPPTKTDIENFFAIFISKAKANDALRNVEIKQTSNEEVFYISKRIEELRRNIDSLVNAFNGDVTLQWKSRIEAYIETIKDFKLKTALRLLETLKKSFDETTQKPSNEIRAIVEYQIGFCKNFLNQADDAARNFIRAYTLNPSSESFKEHATLIYYRQKDYGNTRNLVDELQSSDQFSSVAWAIDLLMTTSDFDEKLQTIPFIVRKDFRFIRILLQSLNAEGREVQVQALMEQGLLPTADKYLPIKLSIDTYSTYTFCLQIAINEFFQAQSFDFHGRENNISEQLRVVNNLTQPFTAQIKGSEIDENHEVIYFLDAYSTFILTGEVTVAHIMEEAFLKIEPVESSLAAYCANALQLAEENAAAINLLVDGGYEDINCLNVLAFCYVKIQDSAGYVATTHKMLKVIQTIPSHYLPSFLNTMIQIYWMGRQADFSAADFLDGKQFGSSDNEQLATTITNLLFESINDEKIAALNELIDRLGAPEYLSIIATVFHLAGAHELSVSTFRKFINYHEQSRDLFNYIYALYNTKKDTAELLQLLECWRINFEFNPQFLKAELHLRSELLEYSTCIEIAEYYLKRIPNDEYMLVNYAVSLSFEGSEKSNLIIEEYSQTLRDFDYNSVISVASVATVLNNRKCFAASIELLYRYARSEENKGLRMNFFWACVQAGQKSHVDILEEYEMVEVGTFVKYELDRKFYITEISNSNKNNGLEKSLLGKTVNEVISVTRPLTGEEDLIKVVRIMNKYLALHDQILEDVKNDPYSGIPMASINFDSDQPESILEKMQELFGKIGTEHKQYRESQIERYYKSEISFSELVFSTLDNDYLAGYIYMSLANKGIMSIPSAFYQHEVPSDSKFIVDFSSITIIFQICKTHSVSISEKLFVSRYIVDRLKRKLDKLKAEASSSMSLAITNTEITVYKQEEFRTANDIKYIEDLLQWLHQNCEVLASARFGDFSRSAGYRDEQKVFFDYMVNTALIAEDQNCMLITDDSFYVKSGFVHLMRQCSSEMYIKYLVGNQHNCLKEFLINRYIGFSPTAAQINEEYIKKGAGETNYYELCLDNINLLRNPAMSIPAIEHIKDIAVRQSILLSQQKTDITNVFVKLLRGTPQNIRHGVETLTRMKCELLGPKLDIILHCLRAALPILESEF